MKPLFPTTLIRQIATEHHEMLQSCHSVGLLPRMFADSTHQAWSCCFLELQCVLKVCSIDDVKKSPFWQTMQTLFGFDFVESLDQYHSVYQQTNKMTPLTIPRLIDAAGGYYHQRGFLLTELVAGVVIDPRDIKKQYVEQLARHIAALHQYSQTKFGPLFAPHLSAERWTHHLSKTLQIRAREQNVESVMLDKVLAQLANFKLDLFYPIMPDLRWDQFLVMDDGALCLIDLDAMVWAPRELELVLIEFLLNESELHVFKAIYTQSHSIPDLDSVRDVYRLLLFVMNVLGESDIEKWMEHPVRF